MSEQRMVGGQYNGWRLGDIQPPYLRWVLSHKTLLPSLRKAIEVELARLRWDRSRPNFPPTLCEQRQRRKGVTGPSRRGGGHVRSRPFEIDQV
jgi:hypothetical protein